MRRELKNSTGFRNEMASVWQQKSEREQERSLEQKFEQRIELAWEFEQKQAWTA